MHMLFHTMSRKSSNERSECRIFRDGWCSGRNDAFSQIDFVLQCVAMCCSVLQYVTTCCCVFLVMVGVALGMTLSRT